jgi:hypothetical protein
MCRGTIRGFVAERGWPQPAMSLKPINIANGADGAAVAAAEMPETPHRVRVRREISYECGQVRLRGFALAPSLQDAVSPGFGFVHDVPVWHRSEHLRGTSKPTS